ncbi:hypothetical protein L208DRAFT_1228355, partial [Tricholoma matsutake]
MAVKPLEILKKGLETLQKQVKSKKDQLQACLAKKKSISSQDENWLDHEANLVNEHQIIDALECASDYEKGLGRLNKMDKGVVKKMREVAGDLA